MIHFDKPEHFHSKFEIVSCFVEQDDKILLLHRQDSKPQGNTWGVPAGKLEGSEASHEAMLRELKEETGYSANPDSLSFFKTVFVRYPDYDFVYHIFHTHLDDVFETQIDSQSHKAFDWVTPKEALSMDLITDLDQCIKLFYRQKVQ